MGQNNIDWLVVNPLQGSGDTTLSITAVTNPASSFERDCVITVKNAHYNIEKQIVVHQNGIKAYEVHFYYSNDYDTDTINWTEIYSLSFNDTGFFPEQIKVEIISILSSTPKYIYYQAPLDFSTNTINFDLKQSNGGQIGDNFYVSYQYKVTKKTDLSDPVEDVWDVPVAHNNYVINTVSLPIYYGFEYNILRYKSNSSGEYLPPRNEGLEYFGANIISHTYTQTGQWEIVFDGAITSIGEDAFNYEDQAFRPDLISITIPAKVKTIQESAFNSQQILSSVIFLGDELEVIEGDVFDYCQALTGITLSENLRYIGAGAFASTPLQSITFPENLEYIGSMAFYGCGSLKSITIPSKVENIETGTFHGCTGVTAITISEGVKTIGRAAFTNFAAGVTTVTTISLPNSLERVEAFAFESRHLNELIIPPNVTYIGENAFTVNNYKHIYFYPTVAPSFETPSYVEPYVEGPITASHCTFHYPAGSDYSSWIAIPWYDCRFVGDL